MSFHFLPQICGEKQEILKYETERNGIIAKEIVDKAVKKLIQKRTIRNLIKLGIAMHSYADTWSHEGFTGNRSRKNNVLKKVFINENDKWTRDISLKRILCRMLPSIGHSKVYALPDISNINWRYTKNGDKIIRNNTELFLEASENIYQIFCNINNTIPKWQKIKNNVREYLYTGNLNMFTNIKFDYDRFSWREISLHGNSHNWENYSKSDYQKLSFSAKDDYRWFYFHEEAAKQRYLVIKHLNRYGK